MQKGRHKKRKDLEALGITDEALIGKIMDLNGADINEAKGKADEYKAKLDAAGNAAPGRLVEDVARTLARGKAGIQIANIALDKLIAGMAGKQVHILLLAGGEVV